MPTYLLPITQEDRGRLRTHVRPPNYLSQSSTIDLSTMRLNRQDELSLKCSLEPKASTFKNGFFFRAHILWNNLPSDLKQEECSSKFKSLLISHLWDIILNPD